MEDNQEDTLRTALGTPQRVFKRTQRYVCNGSYSYYYFQNLCNFGKKSTGRFVRYCASKLCVKYPEHVIPGFSQILTLVTPLKL